MILLSFESFQQGFVFDYVLFVGSSHGSICFVTIQTSRVQERRSSWLVSHFPHSLTKFISTIVTIGRVFHMSFIHINISLILFYKWLD